jgi:hypothetical protein
VGSKEISHPRAGKKLIEKERTMSNQIKGSEDEQKVGRLRYWLFRSLVDIRKPKGILEGAKK